MAMSTYNKRNNVEYYTAKDGIEQYCVNANGHQYYAKEGSNKEIYAKNEKGLPYYAVDALNNQYYATISNGQENPIKHVVNGEDVQIYAFDAERNEIYPKSFGREFLLTKNGNYYYATDNSGTGIYPKNKFGIEYVETTLGHIKYPDGKIKPPIGSSGRPVFNKTINGEEYFKDDNGEPYFCKNKMGDEVYAKDSIGNEYYPKPGLYAKDRTGNFYYAVDANEMIIYPKNEKGECYIETSRGSYHLLKSNRSFVTYARQGPKQIYPIKKNNTKQTEYIIDGYATISKNLKEYAYYPKDSDFNEYVHNGEFIEEEGYPITSDGYIIIPNIDNTPKFIENKIMQYTKLLYRPDFKSYDFLTNVLSTRPGQGKNVLYKTLNISSPRITVLHYIIAFLVIINILLLSRL